ncbi:MAG: 50S ribosomal protein L24 [Clostridiales bacterium]|nr:50S ribosomal protein L24 [Clostridiales bacterium]
MNKTDEYPKIHVKKGDVVMVISGKDSGKKGKILSVETKSGRVYVDKVNVVSRHTKPTQSQPRGGIIKKEAAIHSSNVMLYCDKCRKGVRVKKEIVFDGTKERRLRKCASCGELFDK